MMPAKTIDPLGLSTALPRLARRRLDHALRAQRELRQARACDHIVLSRPKSGRTWLRVMLSHLYQSAYGLPRDQLLEFDNFHARNPAVPRILFTHGTYLRRVLASRWAGLGVRERPVLMLVRNPCDVAVSEYFQTTRRASWRKRELQGSRAVPSMFDFVMRGELGLPGIIDYCNRWDRVLTSLPHVCVIRYEDLHADPAGQLTRAAGFFGAPVSDAQIAEAVEFSCFERMRELERSNFFDSPRLAPRDPADPDSYKVRRGVVGGYRDYFAAEQREAMEQLVRSRLSERFGYGAAGEGSGGG